MNDKAMESGVRISGEGGTERMQEMILLAIEGGPESMKSLLNSLWSLCRGGEEVKTTVFKEHFSPGSLFWSSENLRDGEWSQSICGGVNWSEHSKTFSVNT